MKTTSHLRPTGRSARLALALVALAFATAQAPRAAAADPTLAEMLELGIYSEETKGDLTAAVKLYEQIVAESAADQALAAQAQFRLAVCLHKQNDFTAATAAFEKLVRDFPAQKELVSLANEYLADGVALLPVPWPASEQLRFDVLLTSGFKIGARQLNIAADTRDGRAIWRFTSNMLHNVHALSRVEVDAATFRPLHCNWTFLPLGEAETTYTDTGAVVKVKGKDEPRHVELSGAFYDNEQAIQLIRRLPLAVGFKTTLQIFVGLGGGNVIPFELTVAAIETITVPAGEIECFKLTTNIGQTLWYATNASRMPVKFEEGGARIELATIAQREPTEPARYTDPRFGFSFVAPAAWLVIRKQDADEPKRASVYVVDDTGLAVAQVKVEPAANFDDATRASARAFAEHQLAQGAKYATKMQIRPDSWKETTVAGQPACTVVFDSEQQNEARVTRGVYAFVNGQTVDIWASSRPENFAAFQVAFDALVASYRGE